MSTKNRQLGDVLKVASFVTANSTIVATNIATGGIYTSGAIHFPDGSIQSTAASGAATDALARQIANASFIQANAAFIQANTGSGGSSAGPYANASFTVANSAATYANASFVKANSSSFGVVYTPNNSTSIISSSANDTFNIVGISGISVSANASTKTISIVGTPGAQGMSVDYGFVADTLSYSIDYGTL